LTPPAALGREQGLQQALKHALFTACFTDGKIPSNHEVLVQVAASVGLDAQEAQALLASNRYADQVREREQFYRKTASTRCPPSSSTSAT
jgi:predicted DsbA family dithiol-disulfide isomerase